MKLRFALLSICLAFFLSLPAFSQSRIQVQEIQQQNNISNIGTVINQQANQTPETLQIINSSANPEFNKARSTGQPVVINTIKSLVPYEDLYKVLQKEVGKYFILPIEEFESLKKAKEAWLASESTPVADPPPLLYQVNSVHLSGRIEENFAFIDASFKIETYTEGWHEIPLIWGSLAVESVTLNDRPTTLKTSWFAGNARQVQFGKMSKQNILQNVYQSFGATNDTLSQNNWKDTMFSLPVSGKGLHESRISFVVPVQNIDDLFNLQFNITRIPLAFMTLKSERDVLSIDTTSFKDFNVSEDNATGGCEFIGWLGANSDVSIKWRRKFSKQPMVKDEPKPVTDETQLQTATQTPEIAPDQETEQVKPVIKPLVYARSHTLASLGETSIFVQKTFNYTISKAPVDTFTFNLPDDVEIVAVNADRPQTQKMTREGGQKKLRIEFQPGREDVCQIEIAYEAPVDLNLPVISLPEITPVGVERELGAIAVEALSSVEVQPGNSEKEPLNKGVYPLDPLEIPQPLKDKATRPLLLAWRQNISPAGIRLRIKRYLDVPQQTVVADSMDVKTTFTTNRSSSTLVTMNIRNNNKQYLQLQLASGSEVVSTFRGGVPVKPVNSKVPGVVQIPLEMSQIVGEPVDMNLQITIKEPVGEVKWRGSLAFTPPLVDIPVSRFSWYLYAPEDYHLYDFSGTVKDPQTRKDPYFFRGFMHMLRAAWLLVRNPDAIVFLIFVAAIILAIVSRKLLVAILTWIWNFICTVFGFIFGGKGFRLVELMIVVLILGVLAALAVPNFRKAREQARDKACYANQRVLLGAVEMYNMDTQPDSMMTSLDIDRLVNGKYLKNRPYPPEAGCRYFSQGNLAETGNIYCQLHGPIEDVAQQMAAAPSYPRSDMVANEMEPRRESKSAIFEKSKAKAFEGKDVQEDTAALGVSQSGFGNARVRGMQPIKSKFIMTKNFYTLERDLVMAEIASDGALVANSTCPSVRVSYIWNSVLNSAEVVAFIIAVFSALYFVAGSFLRMPEKITFAAIIVILISLIDLKLKTIGDAANAGFWLAIFGAVIWKSVWLLRFVKLPETDDSSTPPTINLNAENPPDAGKANTGILLILVLVMLAVASAPAISADFREIRVMARFRICQKYCLRAIGS